MGTLVLLLLTAIGQKPDSPFRLPDSLVCGEYYQGDGLGENHSLTLRNDHTFKFSAGTDTGVGASNHGSWHYERDVLVLMPVTPMDDPLLGSETRFVPVAWGQAVTLIREENAPGFFANPPSYPYPYQMGLHSGEYLKLSDLRGLEVKRSGKMRYPPRFADFVLHGSVTARVKRILPRGRVEIVSSAPKRLKPGMKFVTTNGNAIEVQVSRLTPRGAEGVVSYFQDSYGWIKVGYELDSGIYPHRPGEQSLPGPPQQRH